MPKIDIDAITPQQGSDYPAPFNAPVATRLARNVAQPAGATDFVANHVVLPPGCWSSQRHWHEGEDEIVVVLAGAATLVDEAGRHSMTAGDIAVFPKNDGNGHHLINETDRDCILMALSRPEGSTVHYPDIDLVWSPAGGTRHRDGRSY